MVSVPEHTMDEVSLEEEDSVEFRVLMSYARRSLSDSKFSTLRGALVGQMGGQPDISNGKEDTPKREAKETKPKRKVWARKLTPACLRPPERMKGSPPLRSKAAYDSEVRSIVSQAQRIVHRITSQDEADGFGMMGHMSSVQPDDDTANDSEEDVGGIVSQARRIVRRISGQGKKGGFRTLEHMQSIQTDGDGEDEIIADIVRILRTTGDQLNEQIKDEKNLATRIREFWSYDFYKRVTDSFLEEVVPISDSPEVQQSSKIALSLHTAAALTALECQPMNKVLGFGARYLKENYSPWIQNHGGWEKVMGGEDSEEEVE